MDFERTRRKLLNIAMEAEEENKPLTDDFIFWSVFNSCKERNKN